MSEQVFFTDRFASLDADWQVSSGKWSIVVPPELRQLLQNLRVKVAPPDAPSWYITPLADEQSRVLEVEIKENDWFHEMCQVGLEDRGLPYDGRGHGEVTFRIWWRKGPNKEAFDGEMWFLEAWLGGAYPKNLEYQHPAGTWTVIQSYVAGAVDWAKRWEIHPDGHIM